MVIRGIFCTLISAILFAKVAYSLESGKDALGNAGITTQLGTTVDLSQNFTDSNGKTGQLSSFLQSGKPLILVPVYYECPRLCGLVLKGVVSLLNKLQLELGKDYEVITISFNSTETPELASKRAKDYRAQYIKPDLAEKYWHFFVGDSKSVDTLMNQIGFKYAPDGEEFSHSTAIMILTPEGNISQYFTDINFPSWDVKLSLVEASKGQIGSPIDHFLLFCFKFDPSKGKYTWAAWNFVRVGVLICMILSVWIIYRYKPQTKL